MPQEHGPSPALEEARTRAQMRDAINRRRQALAVRALLISDARGGRPKALADEDERLRLLFEANEAECSQCGERLRSLKLVTRVGVQDILFHPGGSHPSHIPSEKELPAVHSVPQ